MSKINGKEFKCPKCGCHAIEEVLMDVVQMTTITSVNTDKDGIVEDADYSEASHEGGELDRIQCQSCGIFIAKDYEGLFAKIKEIT
jgi:hypothetical protein